MKVLFVFVGLLAFCMAEQYTDRYDNLNVDEVLSNKRLFGSYIKCMLDQGRCTAEGKALKTHVQDAIQTSCSKCTDFQRREARRVVKYIKEKESKSWEQLKSKYDPGDKYKETYEAFLARIET